MTETRVLTTEQIGPLIISSCSSEPVMNIHAELTARFISPRLASVERSSNYQDVKIIHRQSQITENV